MSVPAQAMTTRVSAAADFLPKRLGTLTPEGLAQVAIVANAVLDVAAFTWSPALRDDPAAAPPRAWEACMAMLADTIDSMKDACEWTGYDQPSLRQSLGIELALLSVGHAKFPLSKPAAIACWRMLWQARDHAGQALLAMREWEQAKGIDPLPPNREGRRRNDADVAALASQYPAFLRAGARKTA